MDELLRMSGSGPPNVEYALQFYRAVCSRQGVSATEVRWVRHMLEEVKNEDSGFRSMHGLEKGRNSRWGDTGKRVAAVQSFLNDFRKKYSQANNNMMIQAAVTHCKVSESFIRRHIKDGSFTIPPKATTR